LGELGNLFAKSVTPRKKKKIEKLETLVLEEDSCRRKGAAGQRCPVKNLGAEHHETGFTMSHLEEKRLPF